MSELETALRRSRRRDLEQLATYLDSERRDLLRVVDQAAGTSWHGQAVDAYRDVSEELARVAQALEDLGEEDPR